MIERQSLIRSVSEASAISTKSTDLTGVGYPEPIRYCPRNANTPPVPPSGVPYAVGVYSKRPQQYRNSRHDQPVVALESVSVSKILR
jgi:hypothetical protein